MREYIETTRYELRFINDHLEIKCYKDTGGDHLVIDDTYDGLPITVIEAESFKRSCVKVITLQKTIKKINTFAFDCCQRLTDITMPEGLESIGAHAFFACRSLKSIALPSSVRNIQDHAFFICISLESIELPCTFIHLGRSTFFYNIALHCITVRFGTSDDWLGRATKIFYSLEQEWNDEVSENVL